MTETSKNEIGNHFRASFMSKSLNVINCPSPKRQCRRMQTGKGESKLTPNRFEAVTHRTQTMDCIARSKKFIVKCWPDTTNCCKSVQRFSHRQKGEEQSMGLPC